MKLPARDTKAIAAALGYSVRTVFNWRKAGWPVEKAPDGSEVVDVDVLREWVEGRRSAGASAARAGGVVEVEGHGVTPIDALTPELIAKLSPPQKRDAQRGADIWYRLEKARAAEKANRVRDGQLVERADVARLLQSRAKWWRRTLLGMARALGPEVAGMEPREATAVLHDWAVSTLALISPSEKAPETADDTEEGEPEEKPKRKPRARGGRRRRRRSA